MKELVGSFLKFLLLFLTPIAPLLLVVGVSVFADTWFGRRAARHLKEDVTSKKTRDGLVPKLIGYQVAVITMFILDKYAINEIMAQYIPFAFLATKITGGFLIWIEWSSINENYKKIHGFTINSKFAQFLRSVRELFSKIVKIKG